MNQQPNSAAVTIIRSLFSILFFLLFWVQWGWGSALAAGLVLVTTGVQGEKRSVVVPVSGAIRVCIELLYAALGLIVTYGALGKLWGTVIAVLFVLMSMIDMKRYRYLLSLR